MTENVKRKAETVLEDLIDRGGDCPGPSSDATGTLAGEPSKGTPIGASRVAKLEEGG
jgi:hypothetical protein